MTAPESRRPTSRSQATGQRPPTPARERRHFARRCHTAAWLATLAAVLALTAALFAAPAAAAPSDPWLDLDGLQGLLDASPSGVAGEFLTVVGGGTAGTQDPVSIDMTVLSIVGGAGPDGALILFQADMTDPVMQKIGNIASGMSGSPLYVDDGGTIKVIGALSYGDVFTTNGLGLATPIEYMADIESNYPLVSSSGAKAREAVSSVASTTAASVRGTTPGYSIATLPEGVRVAGDTLRRIVVARDPNTAGSVPHPAGTAVFAPLTTLQIGGLPYASAAYQKLADRLAARGHSVQRGLGTGPDGWDPDYETTLVPGAACAAMYTVGDLWAGAIGTVTYLNGNALLAFGHPFDWSGPSGLYLCNAWIDGIWSSTRMSYKLGEPGKARGTVTQDRGSGIGARLDRTPAETPITSSATVTSGGVTRTSTSTTKMSRFIADSYYGCDYAQAAVAVPIYKAGDISLMAGGAQTTTVVKVSDGTNQYTVTRTNIWDNAYDVTYDATADVWNILSALEENAQGVASATIVSVDYQATVSPQRRLATIAGVSVPGGLHAGDNTVYVTLSPYGSMDDVVVPVILTLPEGASTEGVLVVSSVSESSTGGTFSSAASARSASGAASAVSRTTLAKLVGALNAAPNNADIVLTYQSSGTPVVAYGRTSYYISGVLSNASMAMQLMVSPDTADYGTRTVMLVGTIPSVAESSTVAVYRHSAGTSGWTLVDDKVAVEPQADGSGSFLLALTGPPRTTTYRAVWGGDSRMLGATADATLLVRARVTLDGRALSSGAVKLTAKVAPSQAGKKIAIERKSGKKWVRLALVKLKSGSSATWTWHPVAGTYRVRAHFLGNDRNAENTSAPLKVVVR